MKRFVAPLTLVIALLAACAPAAIFGPTADPELERIADSIYHRMEIHYIDNGEYSTQSLASLVLPRGAMWTIIQFAEDASTYELLFTSANEPDWQWRITPRGAQRYPAM